MYEEMTYEKIMGDMMEDMPDGVDTSEGSLIYNACAKMAVRLEEAYLRCAALERNMYADTADLEHLVREGDERGCYIEQATYAEFEAQFNCEIPAGSRFNCDEYNYTVFRTVDEENHIYNIGCDIAGSEPNHLLGSLEPIEYINGFEWGKILRCTIEGRDQEDQEYYRSRVLASYNYRGFAGNRAYYKARIKELPGVYGCKLFRVKAPTDRVRIIIIGENYRSPTQETVEMVQSEVDPVVNSGEGDGFAPIGHRVTVSAVEEIKIDIETEILFDTGYDQGALQSYIDQVIEDYFLSIRKKWEQSDTIVVRVLQVEAAIVEIEGIIDVTGTKLNGAEKNLYITDGRIPVRGSLACL